MKRKVNEKKKWDANESESEKLWNGQKRKKEDERMREQEDKIIAVERKMKNENK